MSVILMGVVWTKKFETHAERDVMLALADHADDHGLCWPSQKYVAWKTDHHPDTVKAIYKKLRDRGIIEVVGRAEGGRGRSPVYKIMPQKLPDKPPYERGGGTPPVLDGEKKGGVRGKKGGATDRKGGVVDPPEPSLEPSQEPKPPLGEPDEPDSTPRDTEPDTEDEEITPGTLCQYLREELRDADVPIMRGRLDRYGKEFKAHLQSGLEPTVLYKICDRIVERWVDDEHYKLTAEQAFEDVLNGKTKANGRAAPRNSGPAKVVDTPYSGSKANGKKTRKDYAWFFGDSPKNGPTKEERAARRKEGYEHLFNNSEEREASSG